MCLNDSNFFTKKDKNLKFIITKSRAIGKKRNIATKYCKTKYIALIDADMRPTKNSFKIMLKDIEKSNYAGIEAFIKADKTNSYFDRAYQQIMEVNINKIGPRSMIGTPTLWHSKILKENNFDPFFTGPSDDTDICYRIYKRNHRYSKTTTTK